MLPGSSSAQEFRKYFHIALHHPMKTYVFTTVFLPSVCYSSILLTHQIGKSLNPFLFERVRAYITLCLHTSSISSILPFLLLSLILSWNEPPLVIASMIFNYLYFFTFGHLILCYKKNRDYFYIKIYCMFNIKI